MSDTLDPRAVAASFGAASSGYDAAAHLQGEVREEMLSRLTLLPTAPGAVLDLGAGTGLAAVAGPARTPRRRTAGRAAIASRRAKLCSVVLETDCPRPGSDVLCAI